jgi:hypothetical protein
VSKWVKENPRGQKSRAGGGAAESGLGFYVERIKALEAALEAITDHLAGLMDGPMIKGRGVVFANGVEGIPTIARARELLRSNVM